MWTRTQFDVAHGPNPSLRPLLNLPCLRPTEKSEEPKYLSAIIERVRNLRHSCFSEPANIGFNLVRALEVEQVLSGEFERKVRLGLHQIV